MTVFYLLLLVLLTKMTVYSHGRTYESETTINSKLEAYNESMPTIMDKTEDCNVNMGSYYDYFHLALVWPKSHCNYEKRPCPWIPNYFTVHGLWAMELEWKNDQIVGIHEVTCPSPYKFDHRQVWWYYIFVAQIQY